MQRLSLFIASALLFSVGVAQASACGPMEEDMTFEDSMTVVMTRRTTGLRHSRRSLRDEVLAKRSQEREFLLLSVMSMTEKVTN